ncbi:hypothetical protein KCU89_g2621, partial [Aureobasidium melanogenum]
LIRRPRQSQQAEGLYVTFESASPTGPISRTVCIGWSRQSYKKKEHTRVAVFLPVNAPKSASPTGPTSHTIWTDWSRQSRQGYGVGYCQHSLYLHNRPRSTHFPLLLHLALVEMASNSLLFSDTQDSSLAVQLHPLDLPTTSDYTTCHSMRSQQAPIVGAIIGRQSGHTITMEQAFQCKTRDKDWV